MTDEWVCIATFDKVPEARLCKSQLELEGIPSVLENEFTVNVNWLWNNAVGGIRLHVAAKNREAALQVLGHGRHLFHLEPHDRHRKDQAADELPPDLEEVVGRDAAGELIEDEDAPLESQRETHAKRALMFAVAGMFICPLQVFTIWIVSEVATMRGALRPLYRFYCTGAALIALAYLAIPILWTVALLLNL